MSLDKHALDRLLEQAQQHADQAVARNDPSLYREAFIAMCQAVALLGEENDNWREQVVRATEEYTRTEGI
ncbi:hypothetical protein [Azotobacter chroococcum]|uniref:hypothetical protein n=1 Tax=Azotobacter chroococcum TaxID=353 RepID=UPI000B5E6C7F|nr:hypothetical protein [Azotobacter chroococcum]ASL27338.1 hypothetical protein ACG10_14385 [Azotobacter chroococcum]